MGFPGEYVEFFRVRTPGNIEWDGRGAFWILPLVQEIDFNQSALMQESIYIAGITQHAFTYRDCCEMPWRQYGDLVRIAKQLGKDLKDNAERQ